MRLPSAYYNRTHKKNCYLRSHMCERSSHLPPANWLASAASAGPPPNASAQTIPAAAAILNSVRTAATSRRRRGRQKECQTCTADKAPPYHHVIICCHGEIPLNFNPPPNALRLPDCWPPLLLPPPPPSEHKVLGMVELGGRGVGGGAVIFGIV